MAQGPRSAGREGAPGSGPTAHGPCATFCGSAPAPASVVACTGTGDLPSPPLRYTFPPPASVCKPIPAAGTPAQVTSRPPRALSLQHPRLARGWEQQPRGDKVGTSQELHVRLGSEGSLTGAYGPVQERLDVLGDDAEHLDHCAETARREGRRAGPASPTPPLRPPPGPTAFWLLPIAPAVALGGGGRHPYWPCLPQPRPAHRWRGRRAPA